ncbi:MAG TPA: DUF3667 domain-containing protein [Sphingobium sp.]
MSGEMEAAGDALTGGLAAGAVDHELNPGGAKAHRDAHHSTCLNCSAALTGPYCAQCGQAAHLHRSLHSLGHDILHGVFHFEGRIWRTLPELMFHPGRLTRRFINGERAKFVSPMALFLFTVFLMFAVYGFTGGAFINAPTGVTVLGQGPQVGDWNAGVRAEYARAEKDISTLRAARSAPGISDADREKLDRKIEQRTDERDGMAGVAVGDWDKVAELGKRTEAKRAAMNDDAVDVDGGLHTGWAALDRAVNEGAKKANENPQLLLYKLKTSGYKYSWALIPLSIPFMWLLFFWRRDIPLYDHAIFVTYSISFMMLLVILLSLGTIAGLSGWIWGAALTIIPPTHMYKQLRGAYGLTRAGAAMRLVLLMIFAFLVMFLFSIMLVAMGVLE